MNWLNVYNRIIKKARFRTVFYNVYHERHHIIPKSIFNNNYAQKILNIYNIKTIEENVNKVLLTAREHFICHLLLVSIFKNNKYCYFKMLCAFNMMSHISKVKNSKKYKKLREEYSIMLSEIMKGKPSRAKGKKWNQESKDNKSKNHYMKGKTYKEIYGEEKALELKKTKKFKKGYKMSEETKRKLRERTISDIWKSNISESKKGIKLSTDTKNKIKKVMNNSLSNPNVQQQFYFFKNIEKDQEIIARKYDMKKLFNLSNIHKLIRNEISSAKGWILVAKVPVIYGKNIKNIVLQNNILKDDITELCKTI